MKKFSYRFVISFFILIIACSTNNYSDNLGYKKNKVSEDAASSYDNASNVIFSPIKAKNGMVSSEQEIASRVGIEVLRRGGNAVDAAVAVGFALATVLPNAGNIGGGGFMLVYDAKQKVTRAIDFREVAPSGAYRDMYLDENKNIIDGKSIYTHYAVGVPGTVAGFEYAWKKWGKISWNQLIEPAIKLANQGILVSEPLASKLKIEKEHMAKWDATKAIFWKDNRPLIEGELLVQKDLANSLRLIAKNGAKEFYFGSIAKKIAKEMETYPGTITLKDLNNYKVIDRDPVEGTYRGYKIVSMPPPSSGGVHVIEILNVLEKFPLSTYGHNSAEYIYYLVEAMKYAYADRAEYLGDPDFVKVPVNGLISKSYAKSIANNINGKVTPSIKIKYGNPSKYESNQTTHYSIVDKEGNVVAVTYTLNTNFGTGIVASGTGILLNNQMDDFSAKPGVANVYGLIGNENNKIEANKRPLSSMSPTIVFKDDKPYLVTGSPGGARIITTVLQTILNTIDFSMNPAEAAFAVRVHHQWMPDSIRIEKGLSVDTIKILEKKGYSIDIKPPMGVVQLIKITNKGIEGHSDPRNSDSKAIGY